MTSDSGAPLVLLVVSCEQLAARADGLEVLDDGDTSLLGAMQRRRRAELALFSDTRFAN